MNDAQASEFKLETNPKILILGPGGPKGFIELGTLSFLDQKGYLEGLTSIVGISVGSIIGLLYCCGYTPLQILMSVLEVNMFADISNIDLSKLDKTLGLLANDILKSKLTEMVKSRIGRVPTLLQLYNYSGIEFVSVSHNLKKHETRFFSHKTDPNLNCVDAVLLSSNIPLLFHRLTYDGDTYVDGAWGDPYPVDRYDDGKTRIIGLYPEHDNGDGEDSSLINIIMSPQIEKFRRICSTCSQLVTNIKLKAPSSVVANAWVNPVLRIQFFASGWKQADDYFNHIKVSPEALSGEQIEKLKTALAPGTYNS